jgi:hypothetical protein
MIFVLELPAGAAPRAWFAFDDADLLSKVAAGDPLPWWRIHDRVTPRELLDLADTTPEAPGIEAAHPAVCALAALHGWDTPLYRADYLHEPGSYRSEIVEEGAAAAAALGARGDHRIYRTEAEATAAYERAGDPLWAGAGWRARLALREQLLALEVLADDL